MSKGGSGGYGGDNYNPPGLYFGAAANSAVGALNACTHGGPGGGGGVGGIRSALNAVDSPDGGSGGSGQQRGVLLDRFQTADRHPPGTGGNYGNSGQVSAADASLANGNTPNPMPALQHAQLVAESVAASDSVAGFFGGGGEGGGGGGGAEGGEYDGSTTIGGSSATVPSDAAGLDGRAGADGEDGYSNASLRVGGQGGWGGDGGRGGSFLRFRVGGNLTLSSSFSADLRGEAGGDGGDGGDSYGHGKAPAYEDGGGGAAGGAGGGGGGWSLFSHAGSRTGSLNATILTAGGAGGSGGTGGGGRAGESPDRSAGGDGGDGLAGEDGLHVFYGTPEIAAAGTFGGDAFGETAYGGA